MIDTPEQSKTFLALTAIEEFWDTDKKIIFTGECCKLYNRRHVWSKYDYKTLSPLLTEHDKIIDAVDYCNEIYEAALCKLTVLLNEFHSMDKDVKYYRFILGSWLLEFIQLVYDRYFTLKKAFANFPRITSYFLDKSQYYFPINFSDYSRVKISDEFSLQIYSQIMYEMGLEFSEKRLKKPLKQSSSLHLNSSIKDKITVLFSFIEKVINFSKKEVSITVINPFFTYNHYRNRLLLFLKSRFKVIVDDFRYEIKSDFNINHDVRNAMKIDLNGDDFQKVLSKLIVKNMPAIYLEAFTDFRNKVLSLPIKNSKAIYSGNLHSNDITKFYLAEYYTQKYILSHQHGINYGIDLIHGFENHERKLSDIFYTWGWEEGKKTRYLPPAMLNTNKPSINHNTILFVMTAIPRYAYKLDSFNPSIFISEYVNNSIDFLNKAKNKGIDILIRTFVNNPYKWFIKDRLVDSGIDYKFDDFSENLDSRLNECNIAVFDHFSNPFIESLVKNRPSICFINPNMYIFRDSARSYLKELHRQKILYYSPDSAIEHLSKHYKNIDTWWDNNQVQSARKKFIFHYGRTSENRIKYWINEFNGVVEHLHESR